jgi:putative peptidoglycan lipid II flippase
MTGGLYRSAHAARDGDRPLDGATLISVDPGGSAGLEDTPGSDQPRPAVARSGDDPGGSSGTAGNSAIMAAGSLVSRITGFLRTVMLGAALGGGAVGNAFTTAQMLPSQIYELLLGGILSSVLVPLLVRRRKSDPDGGQAYTQKLLTLAVAGLGVATLLAVAAAPVFTAIQAGGEDREFRDLATMFAYLVLPIIFFTGISALLGAVLNVRGHFAAPMWAPILNNIVVIAACGAFIALYHGAKPLPGTMTPAQIALIGGGTLLGMVVQAVGLIPALRKVGFRWRWRWDPRSLGLREIGGLAGWMLCYVAANQLAIFVVVRLLNSGGSDDDRAGLLIFNNVFLLIMMAHGVIGVSVMTALMPRMSAAAADGRYADIKTDLAQGIRLTTTALAPVAVLYGVLAAPISVTLFQHGNFSAAQAGETARVLVVGAFAVLPLSISYLFTYSFYALQRNKTAALINLPVVAIRIGVQLALVAVLASSLTAAGLTAGNAVSYLASAVISMVVLRKRIGRLGLRTVWMSVAKVLIAAAIAAGVGLVVVRLLPGSGTPGKIDALLQLVVGGAVIVVTYLGAAIALRVREINQVIGTVRRKIGR